MGQGTGIVVSSPLRTPVGRFGGSLSTVSASDLAAELVRAVLDRTGLAPDAIDDVIVGQCNPNGDAPVIGRVAALEAGLAASTSGQQVDRRCGSGLQAVLQGAIQVQTGFSVLVIAGGAENMSQVGHYLPGARWGLRSGKAELIDRLVRARQSAGGRDHPIAGGMVDTAENVRRDDGISRDDQDRLALQSHERAAASQTKGLFADEIVPVGDGPSRTTVSVDEHTRVGTARLVTATVGGTAPQTMGVGPVPAVARAFAKSGLIWKHIDLIEVNEAFAAQVLACTKILEFAATDLRPHQRQRLGHLTQPSRRGDRRPHPGHPAARARAPAGPLRDRGDVHRWRTRLRSHLRACFAMTMPTRTLPVAFGRACLTTDTSLPREAR